MEVIGESDGRSYSGPLPKPDGTSLPFWQAAARGELWIQRCPACEHRQFYPRAVCTACGASPEWLPCSGRGRVHTFTIVRQHGAPPFRDQLPYVVAMIELDEGVRMMGNLSGCDVDQVQIGTRVEAYAQIAALEGAEAETIGIVQWRPTD